MRLQRIDKLNLAGSGIRLLARITAELIHSHPLGMKAGSSRVVDQHSHRIRNLLSIQEFADCLCLARMLDVAGNRLC